MSQPDNPDRPLGPLETTRSLHAVAASPSAKDLARARLEAMKLAAVHIEALIADGELHEAEKALFAAIGDHGEHEAFGRLMEEIWTLHEPPALSTHLSHLVSHVKAMRVQGNLQGAAALLRQVSHQGAANTEIRTLLARTQRDIRVEEEASAWQGLIAETRERIQELVGLEELTEAADALRQVERRHGTLDELADLRQAIEERLRQQERERLQFHLSEADRLEGEGRLTESLEQMRQALLLDPEAEGAREFVDSLIARIEERKVAEAIARETDRIDFLLARGRLWRALLSIRGSGRKYGELPAFLHRERRCQRLRATRWARRWQRVQSAGARSWGQVQSAGARGWQRVAQTGRAAVHSVQLRVEERKRMARRRLVARLRQERRERAALIADTLVQVEQLVEQGELLAARSLLAKAESREGALEELREWKNYVEDLRAQWHSEKLATHLSEARRLREEGRLEDCLDEARRALALDGQNGEARSLVETIGAKLEERKLTETAAAEAARIEASLARGRLLHTQFLISAYHRKFDEAPLMEANLRRVRRVRAVWWGRRRSHLLELVRAIPLERLQAIPGRTSARASVAAKRAWTSLSVAVRSAAEKSRSSLEDRSRARRWVLAASFSLILVAAAGAYLVDFKVQRAARSAGDKLATAVDPEPVAVLASSGDLILDALPWGRVVAIVGQEGEPQILDEGVFTPVRRSLPAGSYRVVLENPAVAEPAEFWVEVFPSGVTKRVHEFQPFSADTYFGKATW
jgi:hypothetical protein